jgi:hypothetical protein
LAYAQTPIDIHFVTCPRCSKLLASPHRLSITMMPDENRDPELDRVRVAVERLAAPARATGVLVEVDGIDAEPEHESGSIAEGWVGTYKARLAGGDRRITATLVTDDERRTVQHRNWFGWASESTLLDTLVAMGLLLVIAIVTLSANFQIGEWAKISSADPHLGWLATILQTENSRTWAWLGSATICFFVSVWLFLLGFRLPRYGKVLWLPVAVIVALLVFHLAQLPPDVSGSRKLAIVAFFIVAMLISLVVIVPRLRTKERSA